MELVETAMAQNGNIARTFARLFSSPGTIAIAVVISVGYWIVFYELIRYAGQGYFLVSVPLPLLVIFVLSSSVLATISIAYIRLAARKSRGAVGVAQSPLMVAAGTAVVTCACNIPLLGPLLYSVGLNSLAVSTVLSSLARFQEPLVLAMMVLNALSACYYLKLIGERAHSGFGRLHDVRTDLSERPLARSEEAVAVGDAGASRPADRHEPESQDPID